MARSLPADWQIEITYAENGAEAIDALKRGCGDVLFLDLTMPVMDGFETLAEIRKQDLPTMVIVVSGDIQQEAHNRVLALGAMDFIKKPADTETIGGILNRFGIHQTNALSPPQERAINFDINDSVETQFDAYREITNVAMGRAGDLLAQLTGQFVTLPIPNVSLFEPSELQMALRFSTNESVSAICQGFIGAGVAGEALAIFSEEDLPKFASLMQHEDSTNIEILTDIAGILLGSVLTALGEQLNLEFSQNYPVVLGLHTHTEQLIRAKQGSTQKTLAIEIAYAIKSHDISCELLLFFTESSLPALNQRIV
ncbi:MAG: response regulator [Pseudomonadales bacterium]|nr:response regulator [Pseudomonadales bacterium]